MRINAISPVYATNKMHRANGVKEIQEPQSLENVRPYAVITFKGGNKGQIHGVYPEMAPFCQSGGVGTRAKDDAILRVSETDRIMDEAYVKSIEFWNQPNKTSAIPFYNCQKIYNPETGIQTGVQVPKIPEKLPEKSPFKGFEGKLFYTKNQNFQKCLNPEEFFAKETKLELDKDVFIVEDVTGNVDTKLDFGATEPTEKRLYRYLRYDKESKSLKPTHFFMVYTDLTASMSKPYQEGGYSTSPHPLANSWKGDPYSQFAKADYEFFKAGRYSEIKKQEGVDYKPATVVVNDCHAANFTEYLAEDYVKGLDFAKDVKCVLELHNGADGYTQRTSYQNMFINIADKEMRANVMNDPELANALKIGPEAVEKYFAKLIPAEIKDAQGSVSPYMNMIYYAEKGYVPRIATVSEKYADILALNPNFAPGTYERVNKLYQKGIFTGYINPLGEDMNPYTLPGLDGYNKEMELGDGVKIRPLVAFDKAKANKESVDINHVREVKRLNKINLFERLQKETLDKLKALRDVKGHERDYDLAITGSANNKVEVFGYIDQKYLEEVKKPNGDVKLIVSWGRMDTQKGLDSVLEAFEKYVKEIEKNPDSVLVIGGPMEKGEAETENLLKIAERVLKNPKLKGRVAILGGYAPNKPLAMSADFAMFPSRFAPCELTDLESTKVFCTPMVTNCQGLAQKNFDATFEGEAEKVTGYKTKHEFEMSYDELKEILKGDDLVELENSHRKFNKTISEPYRITHGGKQLTEEEIAKIINANTGINYDYRYKLGADGLREHRDKVIVDELAGLFKRALMDDRNAEIQTKMAINQINLDTSWEGNGALSRTGKSTAENFREGLFKPDAAEIKKEDTIIEKIRALDAYKDVEKRVKKLSDNGSSEGLKPEAKTFGEKLSQWAKSKAGKWTLGIAGGVAVASAIGFAGHKAGWFKTKPVEEKQAVEPEVDDAEFDDFSGADELSEIE